MVSVSEKWKEKSEEEIYLLGLDLISRTKRPKHRKDRTVHHFLYMFTRNSFQQVKEAICGDAKNPRNPLIAKARDTLLERLHQLSLNVSEKFPNDVES